MDEQFTSEDFKDLMFNVYEVPKRNLVLNTFPELKKYPEFIADLGALKRHRNKVVRYVILCYDKNSPMHRTTDLIKRKVNSALIAGFEADKKSGRFETDVDRMLKVESVIQPYIEQITGVKELLKKRS